MGVLATPACEYDNGVLTALAILEVVYLVSLSVWILLEKRSPAATIAWLLSLAALPVVGFFIYYLFGPRRIHRSKKKRARVTDRVRALLPDTRSLDSETLALMRRAGVRQMMTLAWENSNAIVSGENAVRVLKNGTEKFPALEEAIRGARHHIHLEYYIFEADETGRYLRDLLIERARNGVRVRLLVDAVGSMDLTRAFIEPLLEAGGEYAVFNIVQFGFRKPAFNFRNHRKIAIIDGCIGFTGGLNIGNEYRDGNGFRDTHMRLEGPAVRALQSVFIEDWYWATTKNISDPYCFAAEPAGDQLVQVVKSGPDMDWQAIHHLYFTAITSARSHVQLTTPYFVPDEALNTALVTAAMRGVDVKLIVPRRSDSRVVTWAGRSFHDDLLKAGVRIFEYLPTMLHAKTMSIDGILAVIGTANLDPRSFHLNWEIVAATYGSQLAGDLEALFEEDLASSQEVTEESRAQVSFGQRLLEGSSRVFSPLL